MNTSSNNNTLPFQLANIVSIFGFDGELAHEIVGHV
jgi:hypothetical protein